MSEYDNLNLDNLNSIYNNNYKYIYKCLTKFITHLFECNGKTFELCQCLLLSKEYRINNRDLVLALYKGNELVFDATHFRTLGILPLIIYQPQTFYTNFNVEIYNQWLLNNKNVNSDSNDSSIMFYKLYKSAFALKKGLQKLKIMLSPESIYDTEVKTDEVYEIRKLTLDYFKKHYNWKKTDEEAEIKKLTQSFWEIELTKLEVSKGTKYSEDQIIEILNEFSLQQTEIKSIIKKIGGDAGLEILNNSIPLVIDDALVNQVKDNLQLAFWKDIECDIIENDEYGKLEAVLCEIRDCILICISDNKREIYFKREVADVIDTELIIQQLRNNVIELDDLYGYNDIFHNWVMRLDAKVNDDDNIVVYEKMKDEIGTIIGMYKNVLDSFTNDGVDEDGIAGGNDYGDYSSNTIKEIKNAKIKCTINVMSILYNHYFWKFKTIYNEIQKYISTKK